MSSEFTRREIVGTGATGVLLGISGCAGLADRRRRGSQPVPAVTDARQYSSPGCTCCHRYASYLRDHLDATLEETTADDMATVKRRHGIPERLRSCHTLVLDEYVVEGHVPASVIATLLDERPDLDGIALPGMPAGSPGMGGEKRGSFTVYAVGGGRTGDVYAEP